MASIKEIFETPLISFCLVAYNQEDFIFDAVQGALNQTYEPLEIILSDDCSTDRTFEIIEDLVSKYKGPHKILVNKNDKNIGLVPHVNKVVDLSKGDWIVFAAGDDISLKNRVEIISEIIKRENIYGIGCASQIIDRKGSIMGTQFYKDTIFGSNSTWHRKCFENFGNLPEGLGCEDNVLFFRSLLLGGVAFSDEITVKYRMFDSMSNKNYSNLKNYYSHQYKINNLIIGTLTVRINELNEFEIEQTKKSKILSILKLKKENIENKNTYIKHFLDLVEKPLSYKIDFLFFENRIKEASLKKKLKLLLLTNSFFAKMFTFYSPQWLKISYSNNNKYIISKELVVKNLDNYIVETNLNTHW